MFVEGSPPNLLRTDSIAQVFGKDSTAILSICDPYQQIASCYRRYGTPGEDPVKYVSKWVAKAQRVKDIQLSYPQFPLIRYDDFVADPAVLNRHIGVPVITSTVKGKRGSRARGVVDMRGITTLFLSEQELDRVTQELRPHESLVADFGYAVQPGRDIIAALSKKEGVLEDARERRSKWDAA